MLRKLMKLIRREKNDEVDGNEIVGVCLGWDLKPHLAFADGTYLPSEAERILYKDYFIDGQDWPVDPVTKEKLPIKK